MPIPGVPLSVSHTLDRLARPEIGSTRVARALEEWRRVAALSRAQLSSPLNDWTELIGPQAREDLERALCALPRDKAAALRAEVHNIDKLFLSKTLHDPDVDPPRPWWERRSRP